MPDWEICYISERIGVATPLFGKLTYRRIVRLLTADGGKTIMESPEFESADDNRQMEILIARLGLEGWEPMPVSAGSFSSGGGAITTRWMFKRPITS